jgi:hypothetical protein
MLSSLDRVAGYLFRSSLFVEELDHSPSVLVPHTHLGIARPRYSHDTSGECSLINTYLRAPPLQNINMILIYIGAVTRCNQSARTLPDEPLTH